MDEKKKKIPGTGRGTGRARASKNILSGEVEGVPKFERVAAKPRKAAASSTSPAPTTPVAERFAVVLANHALEGVALILVGQANDAVLAEILNVISSGTIRSGHAAALPARQS
jgi:hypothetical protein